MGLDVFTCARHHTHLDLAGQLLEPNTERHLKNADTMYALFSDLPQAVANSVAIANEIDFTLENLVYEFPRFSVPPGETMDSHLDNTTCDAARPLSQNITSKFLHQLDRDFPLIP